LFIGLTLIYLIEIPVKFTGSAGLARLTGLWQLLTGIWLMYLTYATAINLSLGAHWWL
jgi:succinate-acetate transporter protein